MDFKETLDYIYAKLPMFTQVGASAYKKDLYNTIAFCNALGQPQNKFKSIHVGGTNGKGSTSHMLASILQAEGYKVGLYTSPHLKDFRERIRINGLMISEQEVIDFVAQQQNLIEDIKPSFFEVTVAMAFQHFQRHQVDYAIIEVGLGGRLDSTNIIQPLLSIITNISLDHTNMLGNSIREIAGEKAGIIKMHTPVVIGESEAESSAVFIEKAQEMQAAISFADQEFRVLKGIAENGSLSLNMQHLQSAESFELELDLTGSYQQKNICTVLTAINQLRDLDIRISPEALHQGLRHVKDNTGLMGRWYTLSTSPLIICDTGHNEAGIREVLKNIEAQHYQNLHIVLGMVQDKDITKVLSLLPQKAQYYFCKPNLERGLDAHLIQAQAQHFGLQGKTYSSVAEALAAAKLRALPKDFIFVGGSTFVVAEII